MSPAVSKAQKTLTCIALSIKRGKTSKNYSKQAAKMAGQMSMEQLEEYCHAKVEPR